MSHRLAGWLLLVISGFFTSVPLVAAEPWSLQLADADAVVRHGQIWRCRLTGDIPTTRFDQGPYVAQVALTQGEETIATQEYPLARLGQLIAGIDVVLVPATAAVGEATVLLTVTVSDPSRRDLQFLTRALPTPLSLQRGLEQRQRQLKKEAGDLDPLPALWLEQAGELMLGGSTLATCHQLALITDQLDRWLANERTPTATRAWRDPSDGSIQPFRLHPLGDDIPSTLVVMLAERGRVLQKSSWPTLPEAWLAAARSAGCAVMEVYPAGDEAWDGVALPRVWGALAAARVAEPRLRNLPLALVGSGRGAAGVVALSEGQPLAVRALGVIDGQLPPSSALPVEAHERWRALQRVGERPAHLLASAVALSGTHSPELLAWSQRLTLAGHPQVADAGPATGVEFWRALTRAAPQPARREWVVLSPLALGPLQVEQLTDWGVAGSLTQDEQGNLRTFGIARLRLTPPAAVLVDGKVYRDPGKLPRTPRKILGQATGPVSAYAQGPFTVVIGSGESAAAQADNRALAQAFASAWAVHAQGRVRVIVDSAVGEDALPGQHLVLIGNPRSNLVLARLAARTTLPVQWDARTVTVTGSNQTPFLRSDRRPFALAWPHPAADGRMLVILDGRPAWRATGLPLAGLPDLFIGGMRSEDPPAVERTFGNDWR